MWAPSGRTSWKSARSEIRTAESEVRTARISKTRRPKTRHRQAGRGNPPRGCCVVGRRRLDFSPHAYREPVRLLGVGVVAAALASSVCRATAPEHGACSPSGEPLRAAFYAFFAPVSYSADPDPASPGFHTHLGYEADLLTALEAMEGAQLSFRRGPVAEWPGIWLLSRDAGGGHRGRRHHDSGVPNP